MRHREDVGKAARSGPRRAGLAAIFAAAVLALGAIPSAPAQAAPVLAIKPLTWNVIGLDSNAPATGPDLLPVGARVCNTRDATATGVAAQMLWDSANAYIDVDGLSTIPPGDLAPAYFHVRVTRDANASETTRKFRIEASATGVATISTPANRELYVERLISQNRNSVVSITSPAIDRPGHATVLVGRTYTFTVTAKTATGGYEQMETFETFPSPMFRIIDVDATYAQPTGATNDRVYADACGWDDEIGPSAPTGTYRSCVGPESTPTARRAGARSSSRTRSSRPARDRAPCGR